MEEQIFLQGIALSNYKGIGKQTVFLTPFRKFNFFIGPNNSGKSCVLSFIANHLELYIHKKRKESSKNLTSLDIHLGATEADVHMAIGVDTHEIKNKLQYSKLDDLEQQDINKIIDFIQKDNCIWLKNIRDNFTIVQHFNPAELKNLLPNQRFSNLWNTTTSGRGGDYNDWISGILSWIVHQIEISVPKIDLIPAIREISAQGESFSDWSGKGLIEEIAKLQNPGVHDRHQLIKFKKINDFLKTVTESESAEIEIPYNREHILVHMDGKTLPIESLGTGIHEVVMLAAFCTIAENQVVCIEEPELHLHPILQRRLIKYLEKTTSNQYFIATHSPSIIDTLDASIFHVSNIAGNSEINLCISSSSKSNIIRDLGYKASDLLQANAIIWVEGPSDRIYINHWIRNISPELIEGIDYSIMFYGGRLLSHLSANDNEPNEDDLEALIAVRRLNRNLAIVIDSDKTSDNDTLNSTKLRIKEEIDRHGGCAWITSGREIENYIPKYVMSSALSKSYKSFEKQIKTGRYDHVLPFKTKSNTTFKDVDKVKIAKSVCEFSANFDVFDLRAQVEALVAMINHANL